MKIMLLYRNVNGKTVEDQKSQNSARLRFERK